MAKRQLEPVVWLLFSAGGVASALLVPILVLLFGVAFPLGWLSPPSYEQIHDVLRRASTRNLAATRRLSSKWLKRLEGTSHSDSAALIRKDRDAR